MRRIFLLVCGVALTSVLQAATQASSKDSPQAKQLTADELKKLVDGKDKFFFLDVREPNELEELGTLKGYVNIPLGQLESRLNEIPKNIPVVTA